MLEWWQSLIQMIDQQYLLSWFAQYAYEPGIVYGAVIALMVASSFGLPFPEEVTLIGAGAVAYMAQKPELFPPPYPGAPTVDVNLLALICFLAVFLSDFLVYSLGKFFGAKLLERKAMERYRDKMAKVTSWARKYGAFAAGIFRFTPGLRFPGHFSCGMLGVSPLKFACIDGVAALISVPTQVLLVAHYGEEILTYFKQFKVVLLTLLLIGICVYLVRRYMRRTGEPSGLA